MVVLSAVRNILPALMTVWTSWTEIKRKIQAQSGFEGETTTTFSNQRMEAQVEAQVEAQEEVEYEAKA